MSNPTGAYRTGCRAAINIKGEHFFCDEGRPHQGIHGSTAAGTIWVSDNEARALPDADECGARLTAPEQRCVVADCPFPVEHDHSSYCTLHGVKWGRGGTVASGEQGASDSAAGPSESGR